MNFSLNQPNTKALENGTKSPNHFILIQIAKSLRHQNIADKDG